VYTASVNPASLRFPRQAAILLLILALVLLAFLIHLGTGSTAMISPFRVAHELWRGPTSLETQGNANVIIWQLRLPRGLTCLFVGGILGVVGSAFQAQLRNPLADPYVIGVSSGAAVGGALALLLGWGATTGFGKPICGFIGGMLALLLVLSLARRNGAIAKDSLILAGVVVGSFLSAVLTMVLLAAGEDTNKILQWLLGDVSDVLWPGVWLLAATLAVGAAILIFQSRRLNALAFGEATARQLGVNVNRLVAIVLAVGTAMTAIAVGTVGVIGFVGLVAPHIARRAIGVDWRWSLPGSMLFGALTMSCADIVSQRGLMLLTHLTGVEPPVGLVTAFVGAPVLLYLLKHKG
jgi:iron complex transport system permease protein